jgi:hypothetical protein
MEINKTIIEAALWGLEEQKRRIDETIAELRAELGGTSNGKRPGRKAKVVEVANVAEVAAPKQKRTMSASARKRIAAAQKKRWADFHAQKEG